MIWLFGTTGVVCTVRSGTIGLRKEKGEGWPFLEIDQGKSAFVKPSAIDDINKYYRKYCASADEKSCYWKHEGARTPPPRCSGIGLSLVSLLGRLSIPNLENPRNRSNSVAHLFSRCIEVLVWLPPPEGYPHPWTARCPTSVATIFSRTDAFIRVLLVRISILRRKIWNIETSY